MFWKITWSIYGNTHLKELWFFIFAHFMAQASLETKGEHSGQSMNRACFSWILSHTQEEPEVICSLNLISWDYSMIGITFLLNQTLKLLALRSHSFRTRKRTSFSDFQSILVLLFFHTETKSWFYHYQLA